MELPHIGEHCSLESCRQLDFLPMRCDACSLLFCKDHLHYDDHSCASKYKKDVQVPVCPLCNKPVPTPKGTSPDTTVSSHIDQDCKSDKAKKKVFTNRCSKPKCKKKGLVPIMCDSCKQNFCLAHRHTLDHSCEGPKFASSRAGAAAESRPSAKSNISNFFSGPFRVDNPPFSSRLEVPSSSRVSASSSRHSAAASIPKVATSRSKTATSRSKVAASRSKMTALKSNMVVLRPNMAVSIPNMAASRSKAATSRPKAAASRSKAASRSNMAALKSNMAASVPNMAASVPNMAASRPKAEVSRPKPSVSRPPTTTARALTENSNESARKVQGSMSEEEALAAALAASMADTSLGKQEGSWQEGLMTEDEEERMLAQALAESERMAVAEAGEGIHTTLKR